MKLHTLKPPEPLQCLVPCRTEEEQEEEKEEDEEEEKAETTNIKKSNNRHLAGGKTPIRDS